jgi:protein involved in polysaccharide export with SLBB domain
MKTLLTISLLAMLPLGAAEKPSVKSNSQIPAGVTVGGQVRRPGPVPYQKSLTIYAAIQAAGGATEFGSMRRVKVIHDGKATTHDLTKVEAMVILTQSNDTIEVPQKNLLGR